MAQSEAEPAMAQLSIMERIVARNEAYERFGTVSTHVHRAERALENKRRIAEAAARALDHFKRDVAGKQSRRSMEINVNAPVTEGANYSIVHQFKEHLLTPSEREQFESFSSKAATALSEVSAAAESLEGLKGQLLSVLDDIAKLPDPLDEILTFQEMVNSAEGEVASLEETVRAQGLIITEAKASVPTLESYLQKRQDLLAEIATGGKKESALADLDAEINAERKKVAKLQEKADMATENAQHAIVGLQRKISAARERAKALLGQKQSVVHGFLMFEAEKAGCEYLHLVEQVVDKFRQLIAIDTILTETGNRSIAGHDVCNFYVPAFELRAHETATIRRWLIEGRDVLTAFHDTGEFATGLQLERERLAALGVSL